MRAIYTAIFNNFFLKITALFLAAITWAYIAALLYNQMPPMQQEYQPPVALADKNVIVKKVPVHINLLGTPDKEYRMIIDRIRIYPSECVISGSLEKIENISFVPTEPISVEGATRTVRRDVRLKYVEGLNIDKEQTFYVTIPIHRK